MGKKKTAVYAGSFDPPTIGHLNIIKRAAALFSELHVLVAQNNRKDYLLPLEERISLVEELCLKMKNVRVAAAGMLVADYMAAEGIKILVRGVRRQKDIDFESEMAAWNRGLNPKVETVLLFAQPELAHISSSGVKEVISFSGDFSPFVPPLVHTALTKKIKSGILF